MTCAKSLSISVDMKKHFLKAAGRNVTVRMGTTELDQEPNYEEFWPHLRIPS